MKEHQKLMSEDALYFKDLLDQAGVVLDNWARQSAKEVKLLAVKSTDRVPKRYRAAFAQLRDSEADDQGGFMLVDLNKNIIVDGSRYELSADDVMRICESKKKQVQIPTVANRPTGDSAGT